MADKNYEIGYGKPPKAGQFQKGRSGNPSGRPKRSASIHELIDLALDRVVFQNIGGETVGVAKRQIVAETIVAQMLKGNFRAVIWYEEQRLKRQPVETDPVNVVEEQGEGGTLPQPNSSGRR